MVWSVPTNLDLRVSEIDLMEEAALCEVRYNNERCEGVRLRQKHLNVRFFLSQIILTNSEIVYLKFKLEVNTHVTLC